MVFERSRTRISIDYGPRIIGLAHSDLFGAVHPYGTIRNGGNLTNICYQILDYAFRQGAVEIIIGVPLDFDGVMSYGVKNFNGRLCLNFSSVLSSVAQFERAGRLRTLLFDERYTSKEARARIRTGRMRASVDAMSAACLLERYLEDGGAGALDATPCPFPPPADVAMFDYNTVKSYVRSLYYTEDSSIANSVSWLKSQSQRKVSRESSPASSGAAVVVSTDVGEMAQMTTTTSTLEGIEREAVVAEDVVLIDSSRSPEQERLDEETLNYYLIRSQRRKKGTLKSKKNATSTS
eukprot:gene27931-36795_t